MSDYTTPPQRGRQGATGEATRRLIKSILHESLAEIGLDMYRVDHAAIIDTGMMLWDVQIRDDGLRFGDIAAAIDGAFADDVLLKEISHVPGRHFHACLIVDVVKALDWSPPSTQEALLI